MYEFRIIEMEDGNQVIDRSLKTPYNSLTPLQMVEYVEVDIQLAVMEKMRSRRKLEEQHRRKFSRNLLYRVACLCGMV